MYYDNIEFFPIPEYNDYFISKCGKVLSCKIRYNQHHKTFKYIKLRLDKSTISEHYSRYIMKLRKDGNYINERLHRLLAITFIPNPDNLPEVDHKDGNSLNNDLSNLRWCSHQQNSYNTGMFSHNTSGYKGVSWKKDRSRWKAYITYNGKQIHGGYYKNMEDAITSRRALEDKYWDKEFIARNSRIEV